MAFDHRKLISDPVNSNIVEVCEVFCNITRNPDGFCPVECINSCYPICYRPLIFAIPPSDLPTTASAHHSQKTHNLHLLLITSLSILAATCLLFCLYKFYKRWDISRRRRSSSQPQQEETTHDEFLDEDHGPMVDHPIWYIRTVGLQPSVINSITVCRYRRGDGLVEGTECSVCLSEFQEDETLRLLPKCNHAFHIPCIDTWLRSHTNCPMCRARIVSNTAGLPVPMPMPVPEQSVDNRIIGGESQVVVSESGGEFRSGREDGDCELSIGTEEEGETRVENGAERAEPSMEEVDEFQPMRRSVSMDSVSASMISVAVANAHHLRESAKVNQSNRAIVPKKETVNQSLPRLMGGSSMKRSLSCSGKVLLSRYTRSRSRNTVLPS